MSKYGIELYDENGDVSLSVSDRLGRFLGSFWVNGIVEGSRTTVFDIPKEHQELGEIFTWFDPGWRVFRLHYAAAPQINNTIMVSNTQIRVSITSRKSTNGAGQNGFMVWYGVK